MTDAIRHRGPDDQAFWAYSLTTAQSTYLHREQNLGANESLSGFGGFLGFNRLAIRDLSSAGRQPMTSANAACALVFNGEIYNSEELRRRYLGDEEGSFVGTSDTEVVLKLYERMGMSRTLDVLDGMFSICVVDLRSRSLFLARDHAGIKPLYVYERDGIIMFASEIKALRRSSHFHFRVNHPALSEFMLFRHLAGERTLFDGVKQLLPGHFERIQLNDDGSLSRNRSRYYSLPHWRPQGPPGNRPSLLDLLRESVNLQLVADVSVGCQLSGGVDSSLVSYLANQGHARFDTHSVVVDDPLMSEEAYIDHANNVIGCGGHKYHIADDYIADSFENATYHLDHPIHHINGLGIMLLAQRARQHVTVLLSGEGADELLGGYPRFLIRLYGTRYMRTGLRIANAITRERTRLRSFGSHLAEEDSYITATAFPIAPILDLMPHFDVKTSLATRREIFSSSTASTFADKLFDYEFRVYLPSLLTRQDKMTMAHSIENRVPLLGRKFIADCRAQFTLQDFLTPPRIALTRRALTRGTKRLLKQECAAIFGESFAYRGKQGFALPIRRILFQAALDARFTDRYSPLLAAHAGLDRQKVMRAWHRRDQQPDLALTLLSLGAWLAVNQD